MNFKPRQTDNMDFIFAIILTIVGFICTSHSYNPTLLEINPSNTTSEVNVTAKTGTNQRLFQIVKEPATWFEAFYKCSPRGFGRLSNLRPGSKTMKSFTQTVWEDGDYSAQNATFWIGIFRPYLNLERWFRSNNQNVTHPNCDEFTTSQVIDVTTGSYDQCAYLSYTSNDSKADLVSGNCSDKYHYLCFKSISNQTEYYIYDGFDVISLPTLMSTSEMNDTDLINCLHNCTGTYKCVGFTFDNETNNCTLFVLNAFHNHITYTISRLSSNVTHCVKNGTQFDVDDSSIVLTETTEELIFPACIPSDYCAEPEPEEEPPLNLTQLEESTAEIVKSLTIDPDETSKSKQKLECATDDRTSSKAFGGVSIAVIVLVCSIPLVVDLVNIWRCFETVRQPLSNKHVYV